MEIKCLKVASFTDAWIETVTKSKTTRTDLVASFTDAWIETIENLQVLAVNSVASFTDAWIETSNEYRSLEKKVCRIFYRCVD